MKVEFSDGVTIEKGNKKEKEIVETATMAYRQAEHDMVKPVNGSVWVKVKVKEK